MAERTIYSITEDGQTRNYAKNEFMKEERP